MKCHNRLTLNIREIILCSENQIVQGYEHAKAIYADRSIIT